MQMMARLHDCKLPPRAIVAREVATIMNNRDDVCIMMRIESLISYMMEYFDGSFTPQEARNTVFASRVGMPITEHSLNTIPNSLITVMVVRSLLRNGVKMPWKTETWTYFVARYKDMLVPV